MSITRNAERFSWRGGEENQQLFLSNVSTAKAFRRVITPEYMSAAGYLLCGMSLNKMFPYQHTNTHTVVLIRVHHLYFKSTAFQKNISSGWITKANVQKIKDSDKWIKNRLYSALWLWRWYLSALSLPFGHHEKDYATSQDLFVYANHHLIGQPCPHLGWIYQTRWGRPAVKL